MVTLRKVVFYIFCLIYLIICPLIVLNALGFGIDSGTHRLHRTGLIYISTNPPHAFIFIDDKLNPQQTPSLIRKLQPGEYSVRIEMDNFKPWEKIIPVVGRKATVLENILLVPHRWETQQISTKPLRDLIPLNGTPFLLLLTGETVNDLHLLKLNKELEEKFTSDTLTPDQKWLEDLFPGSSVYKDARLINYFTVDKSPFFVLKIELQSKPKYLWVDPRETPPTIEDITDLFYVTPQMVLWSPRDEKNIFTLQENYINHLDIKAKAIYPKIMTGVKSLTILEGEIIALTEDLNLLHFNYKSDKTEPVLEPLSIPENIHLQNNEIKLHTLTKKINLLETKDGALLYPPSIVPVIDQELRGLMYSADNEEALLWTRGKIGILTFVNDPRNEAHNFRPIIEWIFLEGKNIQQAFWVNDYHYVLFLDGNKIFLVERESFDQPQLTEVATIKPNSVINYSDKTGRIFYLSENDHALRSIKILPEKPLIPISIPEEFKKKKTEK